NRSLRFGIALNDDVRFPKLVPGDFVLMKNRVEASLLGPSRDTASILCRGIRVERRVDGNEFGKGVRLALAGNELHVENRPVYWSTESKAALVQRRQVRRQRYANRLGNLRFAVARLAHGHEAAAIRIAFKTKDRERAG